ncbi:MAG: DUF4760 domain-containing protein [Candidatus Hermodarchaeia archaeon]|jgi:hypothetical protein
MVDATFVLNLVETVGILIGVTIAVKQLRDIDETNERDLETRQTQLQLNILAQTRTTNFISRYMQLVYGQEYNTYEEWIEKYGPRTDPESYTTYVYVTGMYQNLGVLLKRKLLSAEEIAEQIRPMSFITLWEKIAPIVKHHRETVNPTAYEPFEYLANNMRMLLERKKALIGTSGE